MAASTEDISLTSATVHLIYDDARDVSGDIHHVELTEQQIREGLPVLRHEVINSFLSA